MKRIEFPYLRKGNNFYPVIDLTLFGPKESLTLKALVDSGASFSLFRPEVARYLGVDLKNGKPFYLEGIGGRILGYLHFLHVEAAGKKFNCKMVFSEEFKISFNLIGRDNFFENFLIIFDEKNRKLVLG